MTSIIDSSPDGADRRSHPRYRDRSPVYVGDGAVCAAAWKKDPLSGVIGA
jgi:hypothetical protein